MVDGRQEVSPATVFYIYAHEDEALRDELSKHLSILMRQGLIEEWYDRQIIAGTDWASTIDKHIHDASIILLLVSSDFLASDYCYSREMQQALERHRAGEARVIPILLRPADWQHTPFAQLQWLPLDAKPVTTWTNQDEAFLSIAEGIRAAIEQLRSFDSSNYSHTSPTLSSTGSSRQRSSIARQPKRRDLNQQRLLERVRTTWITGVLDHSLHGAALIAVGLNEQPEAVENPWHLVVQETGLPPRFLPSGTSITQAYDAANQELLILGEPGAGKTTLLLALARDLLYRAARDEMHPIPVIFHLSSWAIERQPFAQWLAEEMNYRYHVPRRLSQAWIIADQILPLLDGLDEMVPAHQTACIEAIKTYRQEHDIPMVVCSRSADYFAQTERMPVQSAVTIQPLTFQQIDNYLLSAGKQLEGIRAALSTDPILQELAATPLMLSVLSLTYHGKAVEDLPTDSLLSSIQLEQARADLAVAYGRLLEAKPGTPEAHLARIAVQTASEQVVGRSAAQRRDLSARRHDLFAAYVRRMLTHRGAKIPYTPQQTIRYLIWLARQLVQHNQTEFYLEHIQIDWLSGHRFRQLYPALIVGLAYGLFSSIGYSISYLPYFPLSHVMIAGLFITIFNTLLYVLFNGVIFRVLTDADAKPSRTSLGHRQNTGMRQRVITFLGNRVIYGTLNGLLDGVLVGLLIGPVSGWIYGLFTCAFCAALGKLDAEISPAEYLSWSWPSMLQNAHKFLVGGLLVGLLYGLVTGRYYLFAPAQLLPSLFFGLSIGLLAGLIISIRGGFTKKVSNVHKFLRPNQGIRNSMQYSLLFGLFFGIAFGFLFSLIYGPVLLITLGEEYRGSFLYNSGLTYGLSDGFLVGAFFWLLSGGIAYIQHFLLRILLWRSGCIPWNYSYFLDYAAERILLRKISSDAESNIGSGYIFIHRLLLNYFASLDDALAVQNSSEQPQ